MRVGQEIVFLRARGKHTSFRSRRAVLSFVSTMPVGEFLNLSSQRRGVCGLPLRSKYLGPSRIHHRPDESGLPGTVPSMKSRPLRWPWS